jgi:hypothetical protein
MGLVARMPIAQSFVNPMPPAATPAASFHLVHRLPPYGDYQVCAFDVATLPGVLADTGTLECDTNEELHSTLRDEDGRMRRLGAWGADDPEYRGEAYVAEGTGRASIVSFTPNEVVVRVEGARPGDTLVLNQNWDAGWRADGARATAHADAVAFVLGAPDQTVRFRYRPRSFDWGLALAAVTAVGAGVWLLRDRRSAR